MPPAETSVADPVVEPVPSLTAIPESAGIKAPASDFGVDAFFPGEKKLEAPATAKPAAVSGDDAPPAAKTSLAAQVAAKAKPATVVPPAEAKKPEAAPAPAAAEHPEDKLEVDSKSSPATREHFKTLKGVTKTLRGALQAQEAKVSELQSKLEAASKAPSATETAELSRLREEAKQLSDRLLLLDTQNHPKFKAQYEQPKQEALSAAKALLGDKASDAAKLLNLPRAELGKAISDLTKDLPDLDRRDVTDQLYKAWQLEQGGREALAKAGETNSAIRKLTIEEQRAGFGQRWDKIVPSLAENIVKLEVPADATREQRESIERYNEAAAAIRQSAEKVALGAIDEDAIVSHAAKSAAYDFHIGHVMPRIGQEISEMQETIAGLTKELAMYRGKNPKRDIGASLASSEISSKAQSIEELADAAFGKS